MSLGVDSIGVRVKCIESADSAPPYACEIPNVQESGHDDGGSVQYIYLCQ
jgi:hypothetical protein